MIQNRRGSGTVNLYGYGSPASSRMYAAWCRAQGLYQRHHHSPPEKSPAWQLMGAVDSAVQWGRFADNKAPFMSEAGNAPSIQTPTCPPAPPLHPLHRSTRVQQQHHADINRLGGICTLTACHIVRSTSVLKQLKQLNSGV